MSAHNMSDLRDNYTQYLHILKSGESTNTDRWEFITRAIEYIEGLEGANFRLNDLLRDQALEIAQQQQELTECGLRIMQLEGWME